MFLLVLLCVFRESIGYDILSPRHNSQFSSETSLPHSYPSCYIEGRTWSSEEAVDILPGVPSPYSCQDTCRQSSSCLLFTWYNDQAGPQSEVCLLYGVTTTEYPCTDCVSGPYKCACDTPAPQKYGDWFCPPFSDAATCHLECHPGYVSDNETVITCHRGDWSSAPTCVAAVALVTGCNKPFPANTVEIYGEGIHLKLPDLPDGRRFHSVDLVNSVVLLCGGADSNSSCLTMTKYGEWTPHSTTSSPRWFHSSVSLLGQLHLMGGQGAQSSTEHFAPPSSRWRQGWDLIEDNYAACSAKINPFTLMMTGGFSHSSSVVSYNVTNGAATRLQDLTMRRYYHGCVYLAEHATGLEGVLVAGGSGGATSEMYDIATGEWSVAGNLTTDRDRLKMVVLGGNVLAMGGINGNYNILATVDRFNATTRQWTVAEEMIEPRWDHAVTGIPPSQVGKSVFVSKLPFSNNKNTNHNK